MAFTAIASQTLASPASSVTFASLPQGFRDLVLVCSMGASSNSNWFLRLNSDSGTNYNYVIMSGNGSGTGSLAQSSLNAFFPNYFDTLDTTITYQATVQVFDYAQTNKHKSMLVRSDKSTNGTTASAGRWASTSAVTSILLGPDAGKQFAAGSTFSLYGVSA